MSLDSEAQKLIDAALAELPPDVSATVAGLVLREGNDAAAIEDLLTRVTALEQGVPTPPPPEPPPAGDIIVKPGDNVFGAINGAKPGQTVLFSAGAYHVGGYGIGASGTKSAPITIKAAPGATFDGQGALPQAPILRDVHDLIWDGFEFTRYHPANNGVLIVTGACQRITFRNLNMHDCIQSGSGGKQNEHLIYFGSGLLGDMTVEDSLLDMRGLSGAGVHCYSSDGSSFRGLVIQRNRFISTASVRSSAPYSPYWAILDWNSPAPTVRDNRMEGAYRKYRMDLPSDAIVSGNWPNDAVRA